MAKRSANSGEQIGEEAQLDGFLAKYTPEIEKLARACLAKLQKRMPGAVQMVYDNYNGLVIGFGPSEKVAEALFSLVMYPKWLNFFFLKGAHMADPDGILRGSGSVVRHIRIGAAADFDKPEVRELIDTALMDAGCNMDSRAKARLVIKSIAANQRPRRPA